MWGESSKLRMPDPREALPGRTERMPVPPRHTVLGTPLAPPYPEGYEVAHFGMGCFWGAEKAFWHLDGVYTTAVGYAAGYTPNPTYREVCTGKTGHNEAVRVVVDPKRISHDQNLRGIWAAPHTLRKTSHTSPRVQYAFTASSTGTMRFFSPRQASSTARSFS